MRKWILAVLVVGLLTGTQQAEAMFLVNTGPGGFADPQPEPVQLLDQRDISVAGRFRLDERSTITGLEGWIFNWRPGNAYDGPNFDKTLKAVLYKGDSYLATETDPGPTPGNVVYSELFAVPPDDHADWHGVTGLNIDVDPGYYWIAVETRDRTTSIGDAGIMLLRGANPLEDYAASVGGSYYANTKDFPNDTFAQDRGFRVHGQANPVPEPSTMGMMLFGLAGLAGKKKFFG